MTKSLESEGRQMPPLGLMVEDQENVSRFVQQWRRRLTSLMFERATASLISGKPPWTGNRRLASDLTSA